MLRLTLTQMRRSGGRLVAAGLAIMLGTAFIAATFLGTSVIRDTTYLSVTADIGEADVVVHNVEDLITQEELADVRALPEVSVADGSLDVFASVAAGGRQDWAPLSAVGSPGLSTHEPVEGRLPTSSGEVALSSSTTERLELDLGDTVNLSADLWMLAGPDDEEPPLLEDDLALVGVVEDPSVLTGGGTVALVTPDQRDAWVRAAGHDVGYHQLLVRAHGGTHPEDAAAAVGAALPDDVVQTGEEYAQETLSAITGQGYMLTAVVLAFGALAMIVAAIVITNTFQVIVAQRTHVLALLRAVGATRGQIRRSVLTEALLLGVLSGVAGLLLGVGLAMAALWVLGGADLPFPLPDSVRITPAVVLVPVITGALVTWLAALSPAHAATSVSPLAALRPPQPPDPRRSSRVRLAASLVLLVGGGLMVAAAPLLAANEGIDEETAMLGGLALGIVGGVVSFAGVMLGMVFVVPSVVRLLGGAGARLGGGTTARIATVNAVRNPRRTAATATALVIGVTLVTLMSTGAVSTRASLDSMLRAQYPVDMSVESTFWDPDTGQNTALTPSQVEAVRDAEGVVDVAEVSATTLPLSDGGPSDRYLEIPVTVVDRAAVADIMRDPTLFDGLSDTTVVAGPLWARDMTVEEGDQLTLGDGVVVTVVVADLGSEAYASTELAERLGQDVATTQLWARLQDAGSATTIRDVQDRLTELAAGDPDASTPLVTGPAAEREIFEQVVNTLLAIVVGLLAVAVVIALIGVANTLSLSVIERRRESALLRAMGLTRGQLRAMLAVEGVILALGGVCVGAVLGLVYGWAGTAVILGRSGDLSLAVPWGHLAAILGVAVLAGLAASVLPARSAVRTPPVAALAAE